MKKINYLIVAMCLLIVIATSCNLISPQKDVVIKSFNYTIKDNLINVTADCDTTLDGIVDITNVPVPMPHDALRIMTGLQDSLTITGILVEYSDHSAIERVYLKVE